jgi:hypothetical protein
MRSSARRVYLAVLGAALASAAPLTAQEQPPHRFEIEVTSDSTFAFVAGSQRWVKRGMRGIAVDPRRRDALVARFEVLSVEQGRASALVTGQTARLEQDYVALLQRPGMPWYKRSAFWAGTVLGAVLGAVLGSL